MNPLTNVRNTQKLNERELSLGVVGTSSSWHKDFKDSAWLFVGGLPYDLTEGDIICVFSQYGEIVNINLVRDKTSGKSKGFCFICYEDQRSTILAVDNLNSIKLLNRTIRVNHVENYKMPKEHGDEDDATLQLRSEGCAPAPIQAEQREESDSDAPRKKHKKEKKKKKDKKKKKKRREESSSEESDRKPDLGRGSRDTGSRDFGSTDPDARDTGSRDFKSRDLDPRDTGSRDFKSRDLDPRDTGSRDFKSRDLDPRDTGSRDFKLRDLDLRDTGSRDPKSRDLDPRDTGSRDFKSRDLDPRDTGSRYFKSRDLDKRGTGSRDTKSFPVRVKREQHDPAYDKYMDSVRVRDSSRGREGGPKPPRDASPTSDSDEPEAGPSRGERRADQPHGRRPVEVKQRAGEWDAHRREANGAERNHQEYGRERKVRAAGRGGEVEDSRDVDRRRHRSRSTSRDRGGRERWDTRSEEKSSSRDRDRFRDGSRGDRSHHR